MSVPNFLKSIGLWVLGLISLAIMFGVVGFCQWGYGQARPHIPDPVRSFVGNDNELAAEDYLRQVDRAFERSFEETQKCKDENDQPCLTKAIERLRDSVGVGVPASASWMGDAHTRLYAALSEMTAVNKLSEALPENPLLTPVPESERGQAGELMRRIFAAQDELGVAVDEWFEQANR